MCGGCIYSNPCAANAAWVTGAGLPESSCVEIDTVATASATCPPVVIPSDCTAVFDPVTCNGNCFYNSLCIAEAAGATGCTSTCPPPSSDSECGSESEAFICGDGCVYQNSCRAEEAGFTPSSDCAPTCRFDLETIAAACPRDYSPGSYENLTPTKTSACCVLTLSFPVRYSLLLWLSV